MPYTWQDIKGAENMTQISSAVEILRKTNDGMRLNPTDLALVERAANSWLTEEGEVALSELLSDVTTGEYFTSSRRWFHGIEHLSRDYQGHVYWRSARVEHFSFSDGYEEKQAAVTLAARCRALETKGFPVNGRTAVSRDCYGADAGTPWMLALRTYYCFFEKNGQVTGVFYRQNIGEGQPEVVCVSKQGHSAVVHYDESAYAAFHRLQDAGEGCMSALPTYRECVTRLERLGLTPQSLDELIQSEMI
jgi:hypothetical protein